MRQLLVRLPIYQAAEFTSIANARRFREHDLEHRSHSLHNRRNSPPFEYLRDARTQQVGDRPHVAESGVAIATEFPQTGSCRMHSDARGVVCPIMQDSAPS